MKFTFLTQEQVFGEEKLSIFNKYSVEASISDFAILLGGTNTNYIKGVQQNNKVSWWWTKSSNMKGDALAIKADDLSMPLFINHRDVGARPAFKYSSIEATEMSYDDDNMMVYYGEYPQTVVSPEYSCVLEKAYKNNTIKLTGKKYTTDLVDVNSCFKKFKEKTYDEYEYGGKKYIRFVSNSTRYYQCLSDERIIREGSVYWVSVEPIKWLIDKNADIAFSENVLFSGIQFNNQRDYYGNFENTDIKNYMDTYFAKDIIPSIGATIEKSSRDEYLYVLDDLTTKLYKKANSILNELDDESLKNSSKALELLVSVQTILEEIDKKLKVIYNSHYMTREKVIAYFENHLRNLDIIQNEVHNLSLDALGLGEYKLTKDEHLGKCKIKKVTGFISRRYD